MISERLNLEDCLQFKMTEGGAWSGMDPRDSGVIIIGWIMAYVFIFNN